MKEQAILIDALEKEDSARTDLVGAANQSRNRTSGNNMSDKAHFNAPTILRALQVESEALGFRLASDPLPGCLLRALTASKPVGTLLELGTGTGVGTAWLLDGMGPNARLISVD